MAVGMDVFRFRIASWLAPELGVLESHRQQQIQELRMEKMLLQAEVLGRTEAGSDMQKALQAIVARSTPGANSTVKAMVKIAKQALG